MNDLPRPFVSVVIPVFNNASRLRKCLEALEAQTYSKDRYEVIVVDNASDEDVKKVVNQFVKAVFTREDYPSSYAARNKGISIAKGEVLAFTDSDCIPFPDWIEKGVENLLRSPKRGLVGGKIEVFFKHPDRPTAVELYESVSAFQQKAYVEKKRYAATANIFTSRNVLEDVGFFKPTLRSGGDGEWGRRVFFAGYEQVYADDTRVAHPARYSFSQLYRKHARVWGSRYEKEKDNPPTFGSLIRNIAHKPIRLNELFRIFSDRKLRGFRQKIKVVFVLLFLRCAHIWEMIRLQLLGGKPKIY
ncbi:MAG: glycosyl transferase family 2 [Omnitrophica bacterium RBG_13_46_9]|nr:MAG: glycosyl transferase family 2 [Omnitrophica bacterium RBG_13_46_9]